MNRTELQSHLSTETKYSKWYLNIILKAKSQDRVKRKKSHKDYVYYEKHHILPKSIFPEYKDLRTHKWNGVLLTAKEHFIIHALIWKHYKKLDMKQEMYKMAQAFQMMQNVEDNNQTRYSSKLYEKCKINIKHTKEAIDKQIKTKKETIVKYEGKYMSLLEATSNKISKHHKSDEYKNGKGAEQIQKHLQTMREEIVLEDGTVTTKRIEADKKASITMREEIVLEDGTVTTRAEEKVKKMLETKSDPKWKETIGKEASRKQTKTKSNPEWKETIGIERIQKMNETKQQITIYKGQEMTIQEMNTLKAIETKNLKSRRFNIYHIELGLLVKDILSKDIRNMSYAFIKTTKDNYLGKSNRSKTKLIKSYKSLLIGLYVEEVLPFNKR